MQIQAAAPGAGLSTTPPRTHDIQDSPQENDMNEASPCPSPKTRPQNPSTIPESVMQPSPAVASLARHLEIPHDQQRSPYSRDHVRAGTTLQPPPMTRTRSLPTVIPPRSYSRSPSRSPVRQTSPHRAPALAPPRAGHRRSFEDTRPPSSTGAPNFADIQTIGEDDELDLTPRPVGEVYSPHLFSGSFQPHGHAFPRINNATSSSRRRPPSPLHQLYHPTPAPSTSPSQTLTPPFRHLSPSPSHPGATAPPTPTRYNESYPAALSTSSSMPSTPTSLRSRSPSISSLETIPDSPDAEEAAMEAFNLADLKAAADAADAAESRRRSEGKGLGIMGRDKSRKRWSVCGAERRGDFEMETIWEDGG